MSLNNADICSIKLVGQATWCYPRSATTLCCHWAGRHVNKWSNFNSSQRCHSC